MKPRKAHTLANAFTLSVQAEGSPEPKFLAVPGLCLGKEGTLTLAPNFLVEGAGDIIFRVKRFRFVDNAPHSAGNEFAAGKIIAGEPDPTDSGYRKAWVLLTNYGQPRLVRLSVIERDGTSELPLQLVVARDYSTHFCAIRDEKRKLLAVLFATTRQTDAGESIEIRSVSAVKLIGARHRVLGGVLNTLTDSSCQSST